MTLLLPLALAAAVQQLQQQGATFTTAAQQHMEAVVSELHMQLSRINTWSTRAVWLCAPAAAAYQMTVQYSSTRAACCTPTYVVASSSTLVKRAISTEQQ
jgi:uncharacterized protein YaiE (UPF0345 family)